MLKQMWSGFIFIIVLLIGMSDQAKAGISNKIEQERKSSERKLTKRGHFDDVNEYSPPIHISSSVLQLENSHETEFDEQSNTQSLHETLDEDLLKQAPIWNSIALGWRPVHKSTEGSNDAHLHQSGIEESVFSYGSSNEYSPRSHLHTQIISSSGGLELTDLNDNIDLHNIVDEKDKHYIKSYG